MSVRDDAFVREDKTVDSVCEEAGSCEASASSLHQFVHHGQSFSFATFMWAFFQQLKKIFYISFPGVIFLLLFFSIFITRLIVKKLALSEAICGLLCYGLFLLAMTAFKYHEDGLWSHLHSLSSSERKAFQEIRSCSAMSVICFLGFMIVSSISYFFLHLEEVILKAPVIFTISDALLGGCFIGFIFFDLLLNCFFKQRSKWHKESSSCN